MNLIEKISTAINESITKVVFSERLAAYEKAVLDDTLGTVDKPKAFMKFNQHIKKG